MSTVTAATRLNEQQLEAVEAIGEVFVSAGAGTGKTSVLVERFVRAVCEQGLDVDSLLVITYTRKAAAELRARIREALLERGRPDLARELDGAWISTIHSFCSRLLRQHPFELGLDPRFRELDEPAAAVLRGEAFAEALAAFLGDRDESRVRVLATYGSAGLRRMLTGVYETLRSAGRSLQLELGGTVPLPEAVRALRDAATCLTGDVEATPKQRENASEVLVAVTPDTLPERLTDLRAFSSKGDRAATYEEARKAVERAALEELAVRDSDLLQELLVGFADAYGRAKRREGAVDFEDLQLLARDLLRDNADVRLAEQERFRMVMVDEFQDTNRLQCELIDLISGDGVERFVVGDEFQSIYGFRHADVSVFRERRREATSPLSLVQNYRSRPEVLAAVNHLFADAFGDEFQPLAASRDFPDPVFGHPVELLVTDKAAFRDSPLHWRRGEAQAVARRVHELVESGAAQPGEIVLLFAAGTDAEWYEEELQKLGLPTYRATGRGYFAQQQVADLLFYLRLLHNRYDDMALATVLASPLVGVSNDALVQIRRHAGRRPLFSGIEKTLPPVLSADDTRLLKAFRQRYQRLVAQSARTSLEDIVEQVMSAHDYDLAVLARADGSRRYANMRKLARLARSYEALRGRDLEGFVRFVRDQDNLGVREIEAVAEEEGSGAVRLLTIHAAKGLEFRIVVVADAGRDTGGHPSADEILALSDGRFGFQFPRPLDGRRMPVFGYEDVKEAGEEEQRAERLRLYYVAMTRAIDRLIVSGALDPERAADRNTPIGWVLERLNAADEVLAADRVLELSRGDARFLVTVNREAGPMPAEEDTEPAATVTGQFMLFTEIPAGSKPEAIRLPELRVPAAPPVHSPRRLSFSAISSFDRCSLRYWGERVAGLRPLRMSAVGAEVGDGGLHATEVGDAVHRLLELLPLTAATPPDATALAATVSEWYPDVRPDELARIGEAVEAYCASAVAARLAELPGAAAERPFVFRHDGVLLRGRLDVHAPVNAPGEHGVGTHLVVDYKTNALGELEPAEIVDVEYALQRSVYALACFAAGAAGVEVVYQFLERPHEPVVRLYTDADRPQLAAQLSAAIGRLRGGQFEPRPSPFACSGCPLLRVTCAGVDAHLELGP